MKIRLRQLQKPHFHSPFPFPSSSSRTFFSNSPYKPNKPLSLSSLPSPRLKRAFVLNAAPNEQSRTSPTTPLNDRKERRTQLISQDDNSTIIFSSCLVGLLTGLSVVLFNNSVHEIRDLLWDGIPYRGASWLREKPLDSIWTRVVFVPALGGLVVSILNTIRFSLGDENDDRGTYGGRELVKSVLKAVAACFTLGSGNSLGPEGPSVEIGASVAKGLASLSLFAKTSQSRLSLLAAGSAAGISSGFNAAVAGCFFAVESVLWPSPTDSSMSLTNTTSMVILSAVISSVVSEVGLGSEPAFKVPEYNFRSASELPLYLLLGILCGLVSLALSKCTSLFLLISNNLQQNVGVPKAVLPVLGGLATGSIALAYPEILYWGFENVDILLECRPFVNGLSANLLIQLVGVKIVATSLCRASGLVGGYYAPSLFIGAATGMGYGKLISLAVAQPNPIFQLSIIEVASPQAYGLVGMAATLAGVCQVPLTAVLLLFELTQDYRIVVPLLGAVSLSSWISSGWSRRKEVKDNTQPTWEDRDQTKPATNPSEASALSPTLQSAKEANFANNLCEVESSLCLDDFTNQIALPQKAVSVSEAMRTRYVSVLMSTLLTEAVDLMLEEKQSCAMIVDDNNIFVSLLTLRDIEDFSKTTKVNSERLEEFLVSEVCSRNGETFQVPWIAKPSMDLLSVQIIMDKYGINEVPVISEDVDDRRGHPVGLVDRESISLTFRAIATREMLIQYTEVKS